MTERNDAEWDTYDDDSTGFELWNDAAGVCMQGGTRSEIVTAYRETIASGEIAEMDLFIEAPDGEQFALNSNRTPAGWDRI